MCLHNTSVTIHSTIKKTIANIEDNLNLDISLNTDYEFSFFPNLSLLTKFNLNHTQKPHEA